MEVVMTKNIFLLIGCLFVLFFANVSDSEAGDIACTVEVFSISDASAWFKNVTGTSCGNLQNQEKMLFSFHPDKKDQILAICLTAISLNKVVWIHAQGDVTGSIVDNVALQN